MPDATVTPTSEAVELAALHACRTRADLDRMVTGQLERLLPGTWQALCLADDASGNDRVALAVGAGCPVEVGDPGPGPQWLVPATHQLPVPYRDAVLGSLLVGRALGDDERALLHAVLVHYGSALVNLTLNEESRQATEHYCASLQALEEGIVLFQEEDPEAVMARMLSLATTMVEASAGALYVLREVGRMDSGLTLEQALGIPDSLLQTFHAQGDATWPDCLLGQATQLAERTEDGSLAMLAPDCVPPMLHSLVVLPLHYHGVDAGLAILFNPAIDPTNAQDHLGRVQSFGQLGAALLHRLRLEALNARNSSIARELAIAETIQKRLLPTKAPDTREYDFAWCSIAAQRIGGDYIDLMTSDLGDIYAVVADASGHGIDSALLMSLFRSTYRGDAPWLEPGELAGSLNQEVVQEVGATGMFITAVTLRIEKNSKRMTLTSSGHCPVMLYRKSRGAVELIDSHGPPLGFVAGASYASQTLVLESGDVVLLYTDGISEAADSDLEMFGEGRLLAVLAQHSGSSPDVLLQALRQALASFTGRQHYDDDVSITVIKVR